MIAVLHKGNRSPGEPLEDEIGNFWDGAETVIAKSRGNESRGEEVGAKKAEARRRHRDISTEEG